ncbi:MAG: hypothetical protein ABW022_19600 [Actinoplanes sp.]|jgi:hypothetical protein
MAALTVVTSTNIGTAQVGNNEFVYIQTCITKAGQARTGLTKQEVTFEVLLVGPGGYTLVWNPTPHGYWENQPGYYLIELIPAANGAWVQGTWIVAVKVAAGNDNGQSLASFTIPA